MKSNAVPTRNRIFFALKSRDSRVSLKAQAEKAMA